MARNYMLGTCVKACILLIAACGCAPKTITETRHTRDTLVVTRKTIDTMVVTEADTASLRLLVECDERNGALVAMLNAAQGERVNLTPAVRYVYIKDTNGVVSRKAYIDLTAIATAQRNRIQALEEALRGGTASETRKEKTERGTDWRIKALLLVSAAAGLALGMATIKRKMWD